jgi:hypothetical protein
MEPSIVGSKRIKWLDVLKELTTHPELSVRDDNIAKAQGALGGVGTSSWYCWTLFSKLV